MTVLIPSTVSNFVMCCSGGAGGGGGGGVRGGTRPGTEERCSHNLQSDPLGSGFKKGRENFLQ